MRKLIGTFAIVVILFLGFFGCEKHNVKPFITNWLMSDGGKQVTEKVENKIKEKVNEEIDSIKVSSKKRVMNVLN